MESNKGTITDIDGNVYHTVTIGTQIWLVENLKTTKYNDGTEIPFIVDTAAAWYELNEPGYCWFNDEESNKNTTGALYNFHALNSGKLCPKGWHVPTDEEWTILAEYLGGENVAGGKMKAVGTEFWLDPNTGATNSSGLTVIPAGFRGKSGFIAHSVNSNALFWSSTAFNDIDAWTRYLLFDNEILGRNNGGKYHGFSIRCLKD
jgi:uncharacterized protein (TIGR02145 family)